MSGGAERSRRYRRRRQDGVILVVDLEVTTEHVTTLMERGYLNGVTGDGETRIKREAIMEAVQRAWNDTIA